MQDVFISHNSKDRSVAESVCRFLESNGLSCWIAPRDVPAGQKWAAHIVKAIKQARLLVLIYSAASNDSEHVLRELNLAAAYSVPMLPFRLDQTMSNDAVEYYIAGFQWQDAQPPPYEAHFQSLLSAAQSILSGVGTNAASQRPGPSRIAISNLPGDPDGEFVGRAKEIGQFCGALLKPDVRSLTLLGPGGIGKTRLALQVARRVSTHFPGGICFVDLMSTNDLSLEQIVATTLKRLLQVKEQSSVVELIANRQLLLVLDNLETVLQRSAPAGQWLRDCPNLKLLVTSRVAPDWTGKVRAVGALALPANDMPIEELRLEPAIDLFCLRAGNAARDEFEITDQNVDAIIKLCKMLEGIPLAIELAASHAYQYTPAEMLKQFRGRFELAAAPAGSKQFASHHTTLQATLDWSFSLLSAPARELLARLSIYPSRFVKEQIFYLSDPAQRDANLSGLQLLADHSWLQREVLGGTTYFRMLDTVREYAAGKSTLREAEDLFLHWVLCNCPGTFVESTDEASRQAVSDMNVANCRAAAALTSDPHQKNQLEQAASDFFRSALLAKIGHRDSDEKTAALQRVLAALPAGMPLPQSISFAEAWAAIDNEELGEPILERLAGLALHAAITAGEQRYQAIFGFHVWRLGAAAGRKMDPHSLDQVIQHARDAQDLAILYDALTSKARMLLEAESWSEAISCREEALDCCIRLRTKFVEMFLRFATNDWFGDAGFQRRVLFRPAGTRRLLSLQWRLSDSILEKAINLSEKMRQLVKSDTKGDAAVANFYSESDRAVDLARGDLAVALIGRGTEPDIARARLLRDDALDSLSQNEQYLPFCNVLFETLNVFREIDPADIASRAASFLKLPRVTSGMEPLSTVYSLWFFYLAALNCDCLAEMPAIICFVERLIAENQLGKLPLVQKMLSVFVSSEVFTPSQVEKAQKTMAHWGVQDAAERCQAIADSLLALGVGLEDELPNPDPTLLENAGDRKITELLQHAINARTGGKSVDAAKSLQMAIDETIRISNNWIATYTIRLQAQWAQQDGDATAELTARRQAVERLQQRLTDLNATGPSSILLADCRVAWAGCLIRSRPEGFASTARAQVQLALKTYRRQNCRRNIIQARDTLIPLLKEENDSIELFKTYLEALIIYVEAQLLPGILLNLTNLSPLMMNLNHPSEALTFEFLAYRLHRANPDSGYDATKLEEIIPKLRSEIAPKLSPNSEKAAETLTINNVIRRCREISGTLPQKS